MTAAAPFVPNPGKQALFVSSPIKDVCYGGARFGGKSLALFLAFRSYAAKYGKSAKGIIFRRTYTELEDLIAKGKKWLAVSELMGRERWTYNETSHTFTCVSGPGAGATLLLRYLRDTSDASVYSGWELPWQGYDEIQNWADPAPIDLLAGCLRSDDGIPTYRRSTCMPGGVGSAWVKDRYRPDEPLIVRKYQPLSNRPDLVFEQLFIPALLEDNPKVNREEYEIDLASIGNEKLYRAWRYGKWDLVMGAFFDCWDEDVHVIDTAKAVFSPWHPRWMSADWGFDDDCVIGWHAQDEHQLVTTYHEIKFNRVPPRDAGRAVGRVQKESGFGKQQLFALGPDAWAQRGNSPKVIAEQLAEGIAEETDEIPYPARADTDRHGGWMLLYQMMKSGLWRVTRACPEVIKSIPMCQHDEKDSADIAEFKKDHAPDMVRYGLKTYLAEARVPADELVRRAVAERVPEAALPKDLFDALPEAQRRNAVNAIMFAQRREEAKVRNRYRPHRSSWRARVGAM